MAGDLLERIHQLPEAVIDHVYSDARGEKYDHWYARWGVDGAQAKEIQNRIWQVYLKELPLGDFIKWIEGKYPQFGKDLAIRIIGTDFMPFAGQLGTDPEAFIRSLGGDPLIFKKRAPVDSVLADLMRILPSGAMAEEARHRLESILRTFALEMRKPEEVRDALMRPEKLGGLGLEREAADRLLAIVSAKLAELKKHSVVVESNAPANLPIVPEAGAPAATPSEKPKATDVYTIHPEDEKEIEDVRHAILPARGAEKAAMTAVQIEQSVNGIYEKSGLQQADEGLRNRLKLIIGNRLRDVRDAMETLETLVQPKELGGMGLTQDAARGLLALIEGSLKDVHAVHAVEVGQEKSRWQEAEKAEQGRKAVAEKTAEEAELAGLYRSVISKSKKAEKNAPPSQPAAAAATAVKAPTAPVPAPPRPPEPPAWKPPVPPPTVVRQPQTPPLPSPRPKMEDIRPAGSALTGPVEELRATSLVDFRRLSKDPKEACLKIKDKIDLLGEQSFVKRTDGIQAWTASEVYRTYLEMMREALEGMPMDQIRASRQAAQRPALTAEETQAVADLSRQLRY